MLSPAMDETPGESRSVGKRGRRRRMPAWLRNAFAIEPPGPAVPTDEEREVVERLAAAIVRRGMTSPALLLLESSRPLNFLGSQLLLFLGPVADLVLRGPGHRILQQFLERRGSVEYICRRIETLAAEQQDP
jgi:hypothetical protein